jgi:serine/threonine-protein kinase
MLLHHARTAPVALSAVSELPIPRDLEDLVMQCLEKEPERRPRSAHELEAALARIPFARLWTEDRARDWWETHAPDVLSRDA